MTNNNLIKTGLGPESVKNMVFGAGVLYKNFSYGTHYVKTYDIIPQSGKEYYYLTGGSSGGVGYTPFDGDTFSTGNVYYEKYEGYGGEKIGATKDGAKVSIIPEYTDIEVDGVLVKMAGLTRKTGEKATIEAVVLDMTSDNIEMSLNGSTKFSGEQDIIGSASYYITTKSDITEGDYINNLALAARRLDDGKMTVIIFKKALCTSGFELDMKNKEVAGSKYVFEAFAELSDTNTDILPVIILSESKN